jgi:hypothetical protein
MVLACRLYAVYAASDAASVTWSTVRHRGSVDGPTGRDPGDRRDTAPGHGSPLRKATMKLLPRPLARVASALRSRSTPGAHSRAGLAQRHSQPPVNTLQVPRRTRFTVDGDAAAPMVWPYVLVVAEARRAGAVSW